MKILTPKVNKDVITIFTISEYPYHHLRLKITDTMIRLSCHPKNPPKVL